MTAWNLPWTAVQDVLIGWVCSGETGAVANGMPTATANAHDDEDGLETAMRGMSLGGDEHDDDKDPSPHPRDYDSVSLSMPSERTLARLRATDLETEFDLAVNAGREFLDPDEWADNDGDTKSPSPASFPSSASSATSRASPSSAFTLVADAHRVLRLAPHQGFTPSTLQNEFLHRLTSQGQPARNIHLLLALPTQSQTDWKTAIEPVASFLKWISNQQVVRPPAKATLKERYWVVPDALTIIGPDSANEAWLPRIPASAVASWLAPFERAPVIRELAVVGFLVTDLTIIQRKKGSLLGQDVLSIPHVAQLAYVQTLAITTRLTPSLLQALSAAAPNLIRVILTDPFHDRGGMGVDRASVGVADLVDSFMNKLLRLRELTILAPYRRLASPPSPPLPGGRSLPSADDLPSSQWARLRTRTAPLSEIHTLRLVFANDSDPATATAVLLCALPAAAMVLLDRIGILTTAAGTWSPSQRARLWLHPISDEARQQIQLQLTRHYAASSSSSWSSGRPPDTRLAELLLHRESIVPDLDVLGRGFRPSTCAVRSANDIACCHLWHNIHVYPPWRGSAVPVVSSPSSASAMARFNELSITIDSNQQMLPVAVLQWAMARDYSRLLLHCQQRAHPHPQQSHELFWRDLTLTSSRLHRPLTELVVRGAIVGSAFDAFVGFLVHCVCGRDLKSLTILEQDTVVMSEDVLFTIFPPSSETKLQSFTVSWIADGQGVVDLLASVPRLKWMSFHCMPGFVVNATGASGKWNWEQVTSTHWRAWR